MPAPSLAPAPGVPPNLPATLPDSPDFALNKITADKQSLALKPGESGDVTFSNSAQGLMTVTVHGQPDGLTVTPGQRSVCLPVEGPPSRSSPGPGAKPVNVSFMVQPTGEMIDLEDLRPGSVTAVQRTLVALNHLIGPWTSCGWSHAGERIRRKQQDEFVQPLFLRRGGSVDDGLIAWYSARRARLQEVHSATAARSNAGPSTSSEGYDDLAYGIISSAWKV